MLMHVGHLQDMIEYFVERNMGHADDMGLQQLEVRSTL